MRKWGGRARASPFSTLKRRSCITITCAGYNIAGEARGYFLAWLRGLHVK